MSHIKQSVRNSLKWKKSNSYCASKLGISLNQYRKLKKEILKESASFNKNYSENINLEKGQGKLEINSLNEPKSPDEIIELLNIDTTEWKLSQYWNKQHSNHWRVSALITKIKKEDSTSIENFLENWSPKIQEIPSKIKNESSNFKCAILSLQDLHFGKKGNYTIDKDFEDSIMYLVSQAFKNYKLEKLYFVIGGDLLNMDTFQGTTTNGTPVNNSENATSVFEKTFESMIWAIKYMVQFCEELQIVYVPGNHDRLSSHHLAYSLSKCFSDPRIKWDVEYAERKVHTYYDNMNCFEHGDVTSKNTPLIYASEFPKEWGNSKHRTIFTGHYHKHKSVEYVVADGSVGVVFKILPSLSRSDYWHYHKKFVGNARSARIEIQDPKKGCVAEYIYNPE